MLASPPVSTKSWSVGVQAEARKKNIVCILFKEYLKIYTELTYKYVCICNYGYILIIYNYIYIYICICIHTSNTN